ncbi:MAG: NifB/NifX family molybdenum-iron cluster-binding protein [Bacteroidales bacterium]|jgi:predicted Fe-Mo cluster-binding NifX family protein|nr:NifB/NifX family molybdenum-iron cluster-binding protein [Bacteroidales bacterium]
MNKIIAIPMDNGVLSQHFGHCETFYLASINGNSVVKEWYVTTPAHEPGLYPIWLKEQGVDIVIAGGMGKKAYDLFIQNGIEVHTGAESQTPQLAVKAFLENTIHFSNNICENHMHTCE